MNSTCSQDLDLLVQIVFCLPSGLSLIFEIFPCTGYKLCMEHKFKFITIQDKQNRVATFIVIKCCGLFKTLEEKATIFYGYRHFRGRKFVNKPSTCKKRMISLYFMV